MQRAPAVREGRSAQSGPTLRREVSAHLLFACSQGVSPGRGCRHGVISAHCWLRADLRSSGDQHTEESWELSAPAFLSSSLRSWTHPWISPASSLAPLTYGLCLRLQEHGYPVLLNLMVSPEVSPHWAPSSASLPLLPLLFCKEKSSDRTRAGAVPSLSFLTSMEFSPCGKLCLQESAYSPLGPEKRAHTGEAHPYSDSHPVMLIRVSIYHSWPNSLCFYPWWL